MTCVLGKLTSICKIDMRQSKASFDLQEFYDNFIRYMIPIGKFPLQLVWHPSFESEFTEFSYEF